MSNRSLARKNRFKYKAIRKTHRFFLPWMKMFDAFSKPNGNGRIYNPDALFPKLSKETKDAFNIIRHGGLQRGGITHPQSLSIASRSASEFDVPFTGRVQTSDEIDNFAKQMKDALGVSVDVPIPPIWNSSRTTPEVNLDFGGIPGPIPDFVSTWQEHILGKAGMDLSDAITYPPFATANKSFMAARGTVNKDQELNIISFDLCNETANAASLAEENRKNILREAIRVLSKMVDNFPDTYHEDFLSEDIFVYTIDNQQIPRPVPRTEPLFGMALCSVIANPKQTEIFFEQGFVSTYISLDSGDTDPICSYEFIVHKPDVYTWEPTPETINSRGTMLFGDRFISLDNGVLIEHK